MGMTACLWFDGVAEEAADFYMSVFRGGTRSDEVPYSEASSEVAGQPAGSTMLVNFEVEGQKFIALNGGPMFQFTEAISFLVERDTQEELDELWEALTTNGGEASQCGWCKDRYGVSWQIVPSNLSELLTNESAIGALMKMGKIEIAELERARDAQ